MNITKLRQTYSGIDICQDCRCDRCQNGTCMIIAVSQWLGSWWINLISHAWIVPSSSQASRLLKQSLPPPIDDGGWRNSKDFASIGVQERAYFWFTQGTCNREPRKASPSWYTWFVHFHYEGSTEVSFFSTRVTQRYPLKREHNTQICKHTWVGKYKISQSCYMRPWGAVSW